MPSIPGPPRVRNARLALLSAFVLVAAVAAVRWTHSQERPAPAVRGTAALAPAVELELVVSGLGDITHITNAGDSRLFVTAQNGRVYVVSGNQVFANPFLNVSGQIRTGGEQGLLSIAFHPDYAENGFFFIYYVNDGGDLEIARYEVFDSDPDLADPASRVVLLTIPHPSNSNHNGGQLQFGPDGYLYIGTGDGGSGDDPPCNAQRDETLLGKILRIDVDQNVGSPPFYGIPPDNPFAAAGGARDEIWAKGVRNPWRFSFDRMTGDLWIGDVGQGDREEIDFQPSISSGGENYGWKMMEGSRCGNDGTDGCPAGTPACNAAGLVLPRYEYTHAEGCSVSGGYVYRGTAIPELVGEYLYGDYCSGRLWAGGERLDLVAPQLSTFGEDIDGELYIGTQDGRVQKFVNPNLPDPTPTATTTPNLGPTPERIVVPAPRRQLTPRSVDREPQR